MSDKQVKEKEATVAEKVDDELSELLDSALEDFKKEPKQGESSSQKGTSDKEQDAEGAAVSVDEWNDEFIKQASAQFENSLASLLGDGDAPASQEKLQETFKQMADAAQQVLANPGQISDQSDNFAASISQTLQSLSQGTENLSNPNLESEMLNMLSGQGDQNAFLPFMQGMMQSLLSKDVLYPSLKDIIDRYPAWLEANKDKLSPDDADRYDKQQVLMKEVCVELEQEKEGDSAEVKTQRFEKVLFMMQKLQDYGQPPTDLVGEVGPPLPDLQGDPNQCLLM